MTFPQDSVSDVERLRAARQAFATIYDKLCAYEGSWPTREAREAKSAFYAALAVPINKIGEDAIEPPVNGETDPEWAAIKRAIDQFAGRVPSITKHRAIGSAHIGALVARLDAAGDREAADTIVWQCWWRALDRERERFLLADAAETRS